MSSGLEYVINFLCPAYFGVLADAANNKRLRYNMLPTISNKRDMMLLDQKEHITREQHLKLLAACQNKYTDGQQTLYRQYIMERNYMILLSLWNTGARVGDVCLFSESDQRPIVKTFDTYQRQATFLVNKRSKKDKEGNILKPRYHTVKLEDTFVLAYHNYVRKWDIKGFLFTSFNQRDKPITEQQPLSTRQVEAFIKEYSIACGLNIHPHMYRHGLAVEMLNSGVPMEIISKFLDHASVETTIKFYAKITPDVAWRFIQDKMRIN